MHHVYYLYSQKLNAHYIGKSIDIYHRLDEHNRGKEKHTKKGIPWQLVGYVSCKDNLEASQLERTLKKAKNPKYVRWYIETHGIMLEDSADR